MYRAILKYMELDISLKYKKYGHLWHFLPEVLFYYNMFDLKNGVALVMLFSGSNLSYNEKG